MNEGKKNGFYGKRHTKKSKQKMSVSKLESKNPNWKGDEVGYISLHEWITNRKPKMKKDGRLKKLEINAKSMAKLTEKEVIEIYNKSKKTSLVELSKEYNVTVRTIESIKYKQNWRWLLCHLN